MDVSVADIQAPVRSENPEADELRRQIEQLRSCLARLSEASTRMLRREDLNTVLQDVIESACFLIGAHFGAIAVFDESGDIADLITFDISDEQPFLLRDLPSGQRLLQHMDELSEPLSLKDIAQHIRAAGFPQDHPVRKFILSMPLRLADKRAGSIYLTQKIGGGEFTEEDREILRLFVPQASEVIINSSQYAEHSRARAGLETLNRRYLRLAEASRILSESLDVDAVLNRIVEGARVLTGAHYGLITTLDDSGKLLDFGTSGFTPEERRTMVEMPRGPELLDYFHSLPDPWRVPDSTALVRELGFDGSLPPFKATLCMPMYLRDTRLGNFYLANREGEAEFTEEDEELMKVFAAQAAVSVANARAYRDEYQAKADLQGLIDTSPVGVLVFDAKTMDVVLLNHEARRVVGGMQGAGRSLEQLLDVMTFRRPDGREMSIGDLPLAQVAATGSTVRAEEVIIELADGRSVKTLVNATPVFSDSGEIVSIVATMQDMTPLEELERMRSEFLGMVSHELRTPLTTIKGSAASVLGSPTDPNPVKARQFFRIIDEQVDHMSNLIDDLLDATRIEAGVLSVAPEPTDVAVLVEEARKAFLRGGARNAVDVDIPPDLPWVRADRQRMAQVLNNLFSNAAKHSPDLSKITVSSWHMDVYVVVSVSDEGRGMAAERMSYLFNKFSQGRDEGLSADGHGLGLAICKGIVESHGGRIWAESGGEGLGMRVSFTIPTVEEPAVRPAAQAVQPPASAESTVKSKMRILAVDDEPQVLRLVRNTLSEAGYYPIVTSNPDEAEYLVETQKPHLVLLDLVMPDLNGMELMRRIHRNSNVPVIFISGYNRNEDVMEAFEAGADDYIVKPFSNTELVARIEAVLRRSPTSDRVSVRKPYVLGGLTIDYVARRVTVGERAVRLTATEYKLLAELSMSAGRVMTHVQLLRHVWGDDYSEDSRLLRSFIKKLRRKLGDDANNPTYIITEPRVGYRMEKP